MNSLPNLKKSLSKGMFRLQFAIYKKNPKKQNKKTFQIKLKKKIRKVKQFQNLHNFWNTKSRHA